MSNGRGNSSVFSLRGTLCSLWFTLFKSFTTENTEVHKEMPQSKPAGGYSCNLEITAFKEAEDARSGHTAISGVAASRVFVYGFCGCCVIWSVELISTIFPRYITAIRVERYRTTGIECEMNK